MKLPKYNQKGVTQILAPLLFIAVFAGIGAVILKGSHAQTINGGGGNSITSTTIYGYKDVNSFFINNVAAQPIADTLNEDGSVIGAIQVANLKAGDTLTWGGRGANIGGPTILSTKLCFTMRDISYPGTAILAVGSTNIVVKPSPISNDSTPFWQYNCVPYASPIKMVGGIVHLYRVDILETLAY